MSALKFLLFKLNTLHKETLHPKLLTTHKDTSTSLIGKFKFATLPFNTDIPQAVSFVVFLELHHQ